MSSLGPLGHPPTAPIVNPFSWAPELPTNRPQMHSEPTLGTKQLPGGVRTHMVGAAGSAAPLAGLAEDVPEQRMVLTPVDLEERAAAAHDMTFHTTSEASGARLDPTSPRAPFGATGKDALGEPLTSREGPVDDPYGVAGGGVAAAGGGGVDEVAALGDGSLMAAEAAIEKIGEGGAAYAGGPAGRLG